MIHKPAGLWIRLLALILDLVLLRIVLGFLSYLLYNEAYGVSFTYLDLLDILYYLLIPVFWHGYTVGKRIVGIRIVREDGENVGFGTMAMREIVGSIVYIFSLGIGVIISAFMVALREDKRSIHDFIAGTYVTHEKPY